MMLIKFKNFRGSMTLIEASLIMTLGVVFFVWYFILADSGSSLVQNDNCLVSSAVTDDILTSPDANPCASLTPQVSETPQIDSPPNGVPVQP